METGSLEEHGVATVSDEKEEHSASPVSYTPPGQFKLVDLPPLVQGVSSDNTELWLIRIQDSQLGPEDIKEKRITMHLKPRDDKLGSFQNSKGIQYDVLDLQRMNGLHPFAFLPKANTVSLDALRISRQVAFVRSLDPDILSIIPAIQEDQCHQNGDSSIARSSKKKHQGSHPMHIPIDGISVEHLPAKIKPVENQARSASTGVTVGGISVVESLRENEETISAVHLNESAKKKLKEEQFAPSPQRHLQEDRENQEKEVKASSERRSQKHKRVKMGEPYVS